MGAWGHKSFENDDAVDFVATVGEVGSPEPVVEALVIAEEAEPNELDAPQASEAIAAAEIVAAMLGKPAEDFPDGLEDFLAGAAPPTPAFIKLAIKATKRVLADSELKELWDEGDGGDQWRADVEGLLARLGDKPKKK